MHARRWEQTQRRLSVTGEIICLINYQSLFLSCHATMFSHKKNNPMTFLQIPLQARYRPSYIWWKLGWHESNLPENVIMMRLMNRLCVLNIRFGVRFCKIKKGSLGIFELFLFRNNKRGTRKRQGEGRRGNKRRKIISMRKGEEEADVTGRTLWDILLKFQDWHHSSGK